MGKSDPYLEFSRQMPDGKFVAVHRTEVLTLLFVFLFYIISYTACKYSDLIFCKTRCLTFS